MAADHNVEPEPTPAAETEAAVELSDPEPEIEPAADLTPSPMAHAGWPSR